MNLLNNNITDIVIDNTTSDFISSKEEQKEKILYNEEKNTKNDNSTDEDIVETIIYDEDYSVKNIINKFSYDDLFKVNQDDIQTINEDDNIENYIIEEEKVEIDPILTQIQLDQKENTAKNILDYNLLGMIFSKYILLSDKDELIILDILNAKYRILYENLLNEYNNHTVTKQILLFPIILELNEYEMNVFNDIKTNLDDLGIEADIFDEYSIAIRTMPNLLNNNLDKEDIRAMFNEILLKNNDAFENSLYKMICKKRINVNLTDFEINELLVQLSKINLDINFYDKKILRKISKEDFEKLFFKD